jgi:hypothetical protein
MRKKWRYRGMKKALTIDGMLFVQKRVVSPETYNIYDVSMVKYIDVDENEPEVPEYLEQIGYVEVRHNMLVARIPSKDGIIVHRDLSLRGGGSFASDSEQQHCLEDVSRAIVLHYGRINGEHSAITHGIVLSPTEVKSILLIPQYLDKIMENVTLLPKIIRKLDSLTEEYERIKYMMAVLENNIQEVVAVLKPVKPTKPKEKAVVKLSSPKRKTTTTNKTVVKPTLSKTKSKKETIPPPKAPVKRGRK